MRALPSIALVSAAAALAWLGAPGISAGQMQVAPQRDVSTSAPPQMRSIPVGTASITGTVTTADGRPVRDARVQISGSANAPEAATSTGPGGASQSPGITVVNGRGGVPITGGPMPGAGLSLLRTLLTDASGRFTFAKLPAGHFTLSASKNNFLPANFGQKRSGAPGSTIIVGDGQQVTANVTLVRGGVITGTIFGADGEPMGRVQVGAWRYTMNAGVRRLSQNNGGSTDDRGVYRLSNLQPGDYLISATPNASDAQMAARMNPDAAAIEDAIASGKVQPPSAPGFPSTVLVPMPQRPAGPTFMDVPAFLPTYHPGTPMSSNAQVIHISGGDEHVADITVQYTEAGSINGTISTPVKPGLQLRVSLVNNDPSIDSMNGTSINQNGQFTFRSLAPGTYTVMAQTVAQPQPGTITVINGNSSTTNVAAPPQLSADDRLWGMATATVTGGSPSAVTITLQKGRSISGVVVFDMARPPDLTRARMTVSLVPVSPPMMMSFGPQPQAVLEADGRFTITGVPPGRYSLRTSGGGLLKSSMVGGVDTLDSPLEFAATEDISDAVLTVTDKYSELSGTLTESSGKPGIDYTIIAASADEKFWTPNSRRITVARTGAEGKYLFRALPPGDYYVVVLSDFEQGTQYDPEFLRSLASVGTRVRISDGAKTLQDLRVR
jgi:protocatechuate 3,4-dioxygenase beta subunit